MLTRSKIEIKAAMNFYKDVSNKKDIIGNCGDSTEFQEIKKEILENENYQPLLLLLKIKEREFGTNNIGNSDLAVNTIEDMLEKSFVNQIKDGDDVEPAVRALKSEKIKQVINIEFLEKMQSEYVKLLTKMRHTGNMNAVRQKAEDIINFIKASRDFENLKGFYKENIKKYKKMPCSSLKQDVVDNDLKAFDDIPILTTKNLRIILEFF